MSTSNNLLNLPSLFQHFERSMVPVLELRIHYLNLEIGKAKVVLIFSGCQSTEEDKGIVRAGSNRTALVGP